MCLRVLVGVNASQTRVEKGEDQQIDGRPSDPRVFVMRVMEKEPRDG
jgi:hypothetical protein